MADDASRLYRLGDLIVSADAALPGLAVVPPGSAASWTIHFSGHAAPAVTADTYHRWQHPTGYTWLSFARAGHHHKLTFPDIADVMVCEELRQVTCHVDPRATIGRAAQALVHHVIPLLAAADRLVLHASAVAFDGGAVAFAGDTGAGKSTLAVSLLRHGGRLLADDALIVDDRLRPLCAVPAQTDFRLWRDTVRSVLRHDPAAFPSIAGRPRKHSVGVERTGGRHASAPIPLRRVFLVTPAAADSACAVEPLAPADAIKALLGASFVMAVDDPSQIARAFDAITEVVRQTMPARLHVPHDYSRIDDVIETILREVNLAT